MVGKGRSFCEREIWWLLILRAVQTNGTSFGREEINLSSHAHHKSFMNETKSKGMTMRDDYDKTGSRILAFFNILIFWFDDENWFFSHSLICRHFAVENKRLFQNLFAICCCCLSRFFNKKNDTPTQILFVISFDDVFYSLRIRLCKKLWDVFMAKFTFLKNIWFLSKFY